MAEFIGTFKRKNVTKSLVWMFAILGVLVIVRTVASPDTGPWTPDSRRWSLPATGDWGPRGDGPGPGARTRHDRGQPVTDNDKWWQHSIGTPSVPLTYLAASICHLPSLSHYDYQE